VREVDDLFGAVVDRIAALEERVGELNLLELPSQSELDDRYVNVTGDTMTGGLGIDSPLPSLDLFDTDIAIGAGNPAWRLRAIHTGLFQLQSTPDRAAFIDRLVVNGSGQIQAPGTGSSAGLLLGGDVQLYRSAANRLQTPDSLVVDIGLSIGTSGAGTGQILLTDDVRARLDGAGGGYYAGASDDVQFYRSAADLWRTPDSLTVDGGVNVGTASGAAAGNLKTSGPIWPGPSGGRWQQEIVSVNDNAVVQAVNGIAAARGLLIIAQTGGGEIAFFSLRGGFHLTVELLDQAGTFSITAGTAGTNVYWSAGNSRYEVENKTGGAKFYSLVFIEM